MAKMKEKDWYDISCYSKQTYFAVLSKQGTMINPIALRKAKILSAIGQSFVFFFFFTSFCAV